MTARVLVTGVWHETNTFCAIPTDMAAFRAYQFAEGAALIERHGGTNTELGGMIEAAGHCDFELLPALFAGAVPGGTVTRDAFEEIIARTREHIRSIDGIDAALVVLHGAMVADGADEADAVYLEAVREALPAGCAIVATFDLHANLSERLVRGADVMLGYDTYPHTDMGARGGEAVAMLRRILDGARPAMAFRKLPLAPAPLAQVTDDPPMAEVIAALHAAEARPGVWTGSIAAGFPHADIAHLGMGVLAYADEAATAEAVAGELAAFAWARRRAFRSELVSVEAAVAEALAAPEGPIILADTADNVGGGSAADGTTILAELLRQGADSAVVVLNDVEAIRVAEAAGLDGDFEGLVGGKNDDHHGGPVRLSGRVRFLDDVTYARKGDYMTGQEVRLGRVAVLDAGGIEVMLTSEWAMPFDADHLRVVGIRPEEKHILVVKSPIAWRAHFRAFAKGEIYVDTPGVSANDLGRFAFTKLTRPLYPLDEAATWP